jgi:hypothetical protein
MAARPGGPPDAARRPPLAGRRTPRPGSKTAAAVALITLLAAAFPDRPVQVVADALYHGRR